MRLENLFHLKYFNLININIWMDGVRTLKNINLESAWLHKFHKGFTSWNQYDSRDVWAGRPLQDTRRKSSRHIMTVWRALVHCLNGLSPSWFGCHHQTAGDFSNRTSVTLRSKLVSLWKCFSDCRCGRSQACAKLVATRDLSVTHHFGNADRILA